MTTVNVYTTETCGFCKQLKAFLKENNVEFNEFNITENEEARNKVLEKTGKLAVPVTEIDDNIVVGFDVAKIKSLLKL